MPVSSRFIATLAFLYFPPAASAAEPGFDIILVAGQSNAVGFGCRNGQAAAPAGNERVFQIYPEGNVNLVQGPLVHTAQFQLAPASQPRVAGEGFATTVARLYAAKLPPHRKVLLVPSALGGSSILQWQSQRTSTKFPEGSEIVPPVKAPVLFQTLAGQARQALATGGLKNRIVALLWHQGETDYLLAGGAKDATAYGRHLRRFIRDFKDEFPGEQFPVILGEIGSFWAKNHSAADPRGELLAEWNAQIKKASTVLGGALVETSDLKSGASEGCALALNAEGKWTSDPGGRDNFHFSAGSQEEMGRRYFEAMPRPTGEGEGEGEGEAETSVACPYSPQVCSLYAAIGRHPDKIDTEGAAYWQKQLDDGKPLEQAVQEASEVVRRADEIAARKGLPDSQRLLNGTQEERQIYYDKIAPEL